MADKIKRPELAELQATITRLETQMANALNLDFERRAEIERLKGGQGEPVAYLRESDLALLNKPYVAGCAASLNKIQATGFVGIYTSQPAPVSVVLKDHEFRETVNRLRDTALQYRDAEQLRERISVELRACLDKVKELNQ